MESENNEEENVRMDKSDSLLNWMSTNVKEKKNNNNFVGRDENSNEAVVESGGRGSYIPYPPAVNEDLRSVSPVELQVSNLDQSMDHREMKKTITNIFREHVPVMNVSVFFQTDGNMAACVRVPTPQDAQYAISQLHRKKIGYKRILISHSHNQNGAITLALRSKVVALLSEVPGGQLPLFKFREMFEKRCTDSIGVSDLYKMRDVVTISEEVTGRMVKLNRTWSPNASDSRSTDATNMLTLDGATCPIHASAGQVGKGWAERENGLPMPNVVIGLSILGLRIKSLIESHGGSLPWSSLTACYEAEFGPFEVNNEEGVPLGHLVTCIKGLTIQVVPATGAKRIVPSFTIPSDAESHVSVETEPNDELNRSSSSIYNQLRSGLSQFSGSTGSLSSLPSAQAAAPLASQLALFSRELVDLLKSCAGCRMPFHKFIPSYHHHFGRQCRVADYGYTKLKDLFDALPHVIQILGKGNKAMITLSHRAQVKRFTSDLLRVLKAQPAKQIALYDLPGMFEKSMNKPFRINDYGVCEIEDILMDVSETSVVLTSDRSEDGTDDLMISIPKREQTNDEVERTHKFAEQCIELLRHSPDCRLPFNKFVPAYHHHFGRQCRVADYGFSKLIELFEAIPTTIEITEDDDGERILQLTDSERLLVVSDQISMLIRNHGNSQHSIPVGELADMYSAQFGYAISPENYGEVSVSGVLGRLKHVMRMERAEDGKTMVVRLIDKSYIRALIVQVKDILSSEDPEGRMPLDQFIEKFEEKSKSSLKLDQLKADLADIVMIDEDDKFIQLVPLQLCCVRIQNLLKDFGDKIYVSEFEAAFADKYKTPLCPGKFGFPGLSNLIMALGDNFVIRGRGPRKMISTVRDDEICYPLTSSHSSRFQPPTYGTPNRFARPLSGPRSANRFNTPYHPSGNFGHCRRTPGFTRPPPPITMNQAYPYVNPGFGVSSGPGCGNSDFWAELAQFGIFPGSGSSGVKKATSSSHQGYQQASPAQCAVPDDTAASPPETCSVVYPGTGYSAPGNGPTSLLPSPHSPSPLLNNNPASSHFAFPPTHFWAGGNTYYGRNNRC